MRKTKIVATLGGLHSYTDGIQEPGGDCISTDRVDMGRLVQQFCDEGADIIRLNLAHIPTRELPEMYSQVKSALIGWEKKTPGRRVAILADLPGPKIRFDFKKPTLFERGKTFTVHLLNRVSGPEEATVYVDDLPMGAAMKRLDGNRKRLPVRGEISPLWQNVLGMAATVGARPSYRRLVERLRENSDDVMVVIGDGEVALRLISLDMTTGTAACRIESVKSSPLSGRKGFTLKGMDVLIPTFTPGDRRKLGVLLDCEYGGSNPEEPFLAYIGLSFCQTADDVLRCRQFLEKKLSALLKPGVKRDRVRLLTPAIVAKMETRLGWRNRAHILDVADALMVARGDLGLQLDIEEVPAIQKRLIKLCKKRGKPVITATEMLKSMTHSLEPTRAEAADVFNAILDGSDAVMTSDETSRGMYPLHALRKMKSIALEAERFYDRFDVDEETRRSIHLRRYQEFLRDDYDRIGKNSDRLSRVHGVLSKQLTGRSGQGGAGVGWRWRQRLYEEKMGRSADQPATNRITEAACTMSESPEVRAILAVSTSGRTVRMISRLRPTVPIIGVCHDIMNTRKLIICFGVFGMNVGPVGTGDDVDLLIDRCRRHIGRDPVMSRLLPPESMSVFTAGVPLGVPGTTNMIQMRTI